jgi:hypothetical protein
VFIFSAVAVARPGHARAAREHFSVSREIVERETGHKAAAWIGVTGMPLGTMAMSVRLENLSELIDANGKLGVSQSYNDHSEAGAALWASPAETAYQRVVDASSDAPPGDLISMTTATIAGSFKDAIGFGSEVLHHVTKVAGMPGMLMLSEGPQVGELTWVFSNESAAAADEADTKLQADADYLALYDRAASLFVPGHTRRATAMRLG